MQAKTVRTCRQLLSVEGAMWLFVTTPGFEPTHNAAERAIRPAVINCGAPVLAPKLKLAVLLSHEC